MRLNRGPLEARNALPLTFWQLKKGILPPDLILLAK